MAMKKCPSCKRSFMTGDACPFCGTGIAAPEIPGKNPAATSAPPAPPAPASPPPAPRPPAEALRPQAPSRPPASGAEPPAVPPAESPRLGPRQTVPLPGERSSGGRHGAFLAALVVLAALLLLGGGLWWALHQPPPSPPPVRKNPSVSVVKADYPLLIEGGTMLPAIVHLAGNKPEDLALAVLTLKNEGREPAPVVCKASLQGFSEESSRQTTLAPGATVKMALPAVFRESLSTISEQRPGAIAWSVETPGGQSLAKETKAITIASRNDMVLAKDLLPLICVFVTPNDPVIDQFLGKSAIPGVGYQQGEAGVVRQMATVYESLARTGVHYSNRTLSYLADGHGTPSQRIYFPRESLQSTNANCIDGTVLLASIYEKLGLRPYIVLVPGHAFLAVNLEAEGNGKVLCVETTLLGSEGFDVAIDAGGKAWDKAGEAQRIVIDVAAVRQAYGILPYPYYEQLGVVQRITTLAAAPGTDQERPAKLDDGAAAAILGKATPGKPTRFEGAGMLLAPKGAGGQE